MTIHLETVTLPPVPARDVRRFLSVTCDLCGQSSEEKPVDGAVPWRKGSEYDITTIRRIMGVEGVGEAAEVDFQVHHEYHVCPECWEQKLEPWLRSQGAHPTTKESY